MTHRTRTIAKWLGALGAAAFLLVTYSHLETGVDRELRGLPQHERATLYERTLTTLRTTCSSTRTDALLEYCREQAEFIERFPECDDGCRQLTSEFAALPTR